MKNKIILAVSILGVILIAATQIENEPRKFGHLNVQEILYTMPEMDSVEKVLMDYQEQLNAEFKDAYVKHQESLMAFDSLVKTGTLTQTRIQMKQEELASSEQKLYDLQQLLQKDMEEKQALLFKPLIAKIEDAIKAVSDERGLDYVFDTSLGALVKVNESDDISEPIRTRLGITLK